MGRPVPPLTRGSPLSRRGLCQGLNPSFWHSQALCVRSPTRLCSLCLTLVGPNIGDSASWMLRLRSAHRGHRRLHETELSSSLLLLLPPLPLISFSQRCSDTAFPCQSTWVPAWASRRGGERLRGEKQGRSHYKEALGSLQRPGDAPTLIPATRPKANCLRDQAADLNRGPEPGFGRPRLMQFGVPL